MPPKGTPGIYAGEDVSKTPFSPRSRGSRWY
jgi:hypothetical protein